MSVSPALTDPSPSSCVATRFDACVRAYPHNVALTACRDGVWHDVTYAELSDRAAALAGRLAAMGVQAGSAVAVLAERDPDTVAAFVAVLQLGAHFVPIDPRDPLTRREALCRAANAVVLVAVGPAGGDNGGAGTRLRTLVSATAVPEAEVAAPRSERAAYVMFTSGSTGQPKGVVVPHRAIVRLVSDQDYLRFDATRAFLQAAPLNFDASTLEVWGPLLHGGRCVLYPAGELPTAAGLRSVLGATGVTTAWLTATLFHLLVDQDVQCLAPLQELIVGGEALSVPHVRKALAALPRTRLVNGYGPTENTTFSTCGVIARDLPSTAERVPIGRAIAGTRCFVTDANLAPVAAGVVGELVVTGRGLALGYLPSTAEPREPARRAFVTLALPDGEVVPAYRTGDRCVQLPDGAFDCLGRIDDQVKIDGHRVEPAEVEAALSALPEVSANRVLASIDPGGRRRLVAYVVLVSGSAPAESLRQRVAMTLPAHLVPHHFVPLAELPRNHNGKLDRAALPSPWRVAPRPRSPRGDDPLGLVTAAWCEVLGRAVDSDDVNFFDAGGRSLDAMRLHEVLERVGAIALEPMFVFEFSTPRRQAQALTQLRSAADRAGQGRP